jgi:RND family efflux transporter MFP subunit
MHPLTLFTALTVLAPAAPPEVKVSQPLVQQVSDFEDFTGRLTAAESVELRARVSGYVVKTPFRPGSEVKRGDLLFEIDPRPYQAEVLKAEAEVTRAQAHLKRLTADLERVKALAGTGNVSREELDRAAADKEEGEAVVRVARAALDSAKLNLDFTRVTAPIDGKVGQALVTPGGLVREGETALTTIVSSGPVYADFDVDERTYLALRKALRDGKGGKDAELPALLGVAGEDDFPHRGKVDFIDNRVDPNKGAVRFRAVFPNPKDELVPGQFARVRLQLGEHRALLVAKAALTLGQAGGTGSTWTADYVLVVDEKGTVERRKVTLGLRMGELREIKEGLTEKDWVIVENPDKAKDGTEVKVRRVEMPGAPPPDKKP